MTSKGDPSRGRSSKASKRDNKKVAFVVYCNQGTHREGGRQKQARGTIKRWPSSYTATRGPIPREVVKSRTSKRDPGRTIKIKIFAKKLFFRFLLINFTTLPSMMNAKLSKQRFWHCFLIAVSKPLLTEFGIHHRWESCDLYYFCGIFWG